MDYIEVSGKNVDEALTNALIKLETTSDKVEYEVIEKGSAGFRQECLSPEIGDRTENGLFMALS